MDRIRDKEGISKRLACMLFAVCLIVAMLPLAAFAETQDEDEAAERGRVLYMMGRKVEAEGLVPETMVPRRSGTITYNSGTKTLTLEDVTLDLDDYKMEGVTNNYAAAISACDDLKIVLKGNNQIISTSNTYDPDKEYVYGIKNSSGFTAINGSSPTDTLTVTLSNAGGKEFTGIDATRGLNIQNCTVNVTISGTGPSTGMDLFDGFGIDDSAAVTVDVSGSSSNAVDGTGMFDESYVAGGATLTMKSDGKAFRCYLPSDSIKNSTVYVDSTDKNGGSAVSWDTSELLAKYKYVKIENARSGDIPAKANRVYILGQKIDSTCEDIPAAIPHSGKVGYNRDTNTVTLDNAVLDLKDFDASPVQDANMVAGIYAMSDLRVVLVGDSRIIFTDESYNAATEYSYGIDAWGRLDISGSGTLSIALAGASLQENGSMSTTAASNTSVNIYGIGTDDSMSVDGATINIAMGGSGKGNGMYLWGPISLANGANVRVTSRGSSNYAVNGVNDIGKSTISADSVLEMISEDNIAFNCWSPEAGLKEAGAMVNSAATLEGAWRWNKTASLRGYRYVRFPEYEPMDTIVPTDNTMDNAAGNTTVNTAEDSSAGTKGTAAKTVDTGDHSNVRIWYGTCMAAAALLGIMTIIRLRRRRAQIKKAFL